MFGGSKQDKRKGINIPTMFLGKEACLEGVIYFLMSSLLLIRFSMRIQNLTGTDHA